MKRQNDKNLNLKFSIVEYIKNNNKLPDWYKKTAMDYYIKPLKINRVIEKKGYGVWEVNWDNWLIYYNKQVQKINDKSDKKVQKISRGTYVRGHGFQFKLKIPKRLIWSNEVRERCIERSNLSNRKIEHGVYKIRVYGHKVWLCSDGIIVYFPEKLSYRGDTAKETKNQAIYQFNRVIKRIENLIGLDLSTKGKYMFSIDKAHYADVNDGLAKMYNDEKKEFKVVGVDGQVWLIIDKSLNKDEKECIHAKESEDDHDGFVAPHWNDLRNHYKKTGEVILLTDILMSINGLVKDREYFAKNMISHVGAIQELVLATKDLRTEIKNFIKLKDKDNQNE